MTEYMKMIRCDCSAADICPQGKLGSQERCCIWRDERTIPDVVPNQLGPREIIDPEYDVSRLGPKKVHENVTDRIESIVKRLTEIEATIGPLAPYRVRSVDQDLAALHARLAKSDEEAALDLVATDARLDRLSGIIDEHEKRFAALREAL